MTIPPPLADDALIAWILGEATGKNDPEGLIAGTCERLQAAGLPLWRLSVTVPAIDPIMRGVSLTWVSGGPMTLQPANHDDSEVMFQRSPIFALIREDLTFGRWTLDATADVGRYPLLGEMRDAGGTDYAVFLVAFPPETAVVGTGISIATTAPGGFEPSHIRQVERVLPALGLAIFRLSLWRTTSVVLDTYLGPMTGRRVLAGEVRRGRGETIAAAIMLTDLTGFTSLSDRHEPQQVVGWLNDHLEAMGEAVLEAGGEILKFLGDGFLAVFPVDDPAAAPCPSCARALLAAERAERANALINARRRTAGAPELRAEIVLHFGDVVYGNVGTQRRLDFTTIGRAVNEASRMEKLCGQLGCSPILSDSFAARCTRELVPLGAHQLRGLAEPRTLWRLP